MKGGTLQITWHGSDPVLTLDFHSLSGLLATGGADHDIKFWIVHEAQDGPLPSATFHSSLSYHTAAVNVVRFSSSGDQLASGADGGEILLWKLTENPEASNMWKLAKNLRFHVKDVLDLQWSSDGAYLVSGSVDNTVIIWDIAKGNPQQVLKDHMHYVQGVAWDPIGQYIASISGDRTCRIYTSRPPNSKSKSQERHNFSCQSVLVKAEVPKQEDDSTKVPATKLNLFHDETLPSFFRRLAWSPDGSFLLVPAGIHKVPSESVLTNTAFLISRKDLSRPAVQLPGASKPVVAVRFCPVLFSCYSNSEKNLDRDLNDTVVFKLPYRLVFAVATLNSLFVYDTQSAHPLAVLAGVHYAAITDISWSHNGRFLAVSSQDGFCSLVVFDQGELGMPLPLDDIPSFVAKILPPAKGATGIHDRSYEVPTKARSRVDCHGMPLKKVDTQSISALGTKEEAQCHRTEQSQAITLPEKQDKRSIACTESASQEAVLHKNSHVESPNFASGLEPANNEGAMVSKTTENKDVPKKPRRITPIAISNAPLQQAESTTASLSNLATPLQLGQQANVSSQSSPKRPRRITPVAILGAPQQDHEAITSTQPQQEANASSAMVVPVSTTQVKLHIESHAGYANADANSNGPMELDASNSKDLQSSPKKLRRKAPVPIMVSCNIPHITQASRDDME